MHLKQKNRFYNQSTNIIGKACKFRCLDVGVISETTHLISKMISLIGIHIIPEWC